MIEGNEVSILPFVCLLDPPEATIPKRVRKTCPRLIKESPRGEVSDARDNARETPLSDSVRGPGRRDRRNDALTQEPYFREPRAEITVLWQGVQGVRRAERDLLRRISPRCGDLLTSSSGSVTAAQGEVWSCKFPALSRGFKC